MLKYLEELSPIINKYNLTPEDVMIVGSGAITVVGGRLNNDIEICLKSSSYKKIPFNIRFVLLFVDHYDLTENVDLFRHRYLALNMPDEVLFDCAFFHDYLGYKIVSHEIEYLYKKYKSRPKDLIDFETIENDENLKAKFDWKFIEKKLNSSKSIWLKFRLKFRDFSWNQYGRIKRLKKRLFTEAV